MKLFDIISRDRWQSMQDGFSKALGICIRTLDLDGRPLAGTTFLESFCSDILTKTHKNEKTLYEVCAAKIIDKIKKDKTDNYHLCSFGLYLYGIPIEIEKNEALAYIILGPVLLGRQKKVSEYTKIAKENNIPLNFLMDKLAGVKRSSFVSMESAVELLYEVAHYLVQLNYDIKKIKKRFSISGTLDEVIKDLYSSVYFEELLNTLLDASLNTAKANAGSIMLLDRDKEELSVRFSRGLKEEIVKEARVKVGEGISGIVAKDKKPLLINEDIGDPEIKKCLKRPNIRSSIVFPLEIKNRLFGVMNINDTKPENHRFDLGTVNLIGNLTNLTQVALSIFPAGIQNKT